MNIPFKLSGVAYKSPFRGGRNHSESVAGIGFLVVNLLLNSSHPEIQDFQIAFSGQHLAVSLMIKGFAES